MIKFIHHILEPHCPECQICQSCETLRRQLEIANHNNELLMNRLLPREESNQPPVEISRPKTLSWAVRKQMLEREDRERARIMKEVPTPSESVESLEKDLGV